MGSPWRPAGVIGFLLARVEVVMSYRVGTENQTWVLCKSSKYSEPLNLQLFCPSLPTFLPVSLTPKSQATEVVQLYFLSLRVPSSIKRRMELGSGGAHL